jgi:hypothetical protein
MIITEHILNNHNDPFKTALGAEFCAYHYAPEVPSKFGTIVLHGIGEVGPADGSKMSLIEKWGWPKVAKGIRPGETTSRGSFEFPFHIWAIQDDNYYDSKKFLPLWVKNFLKLDVIACTGLSLGGIGTLQMTYWDSLNMVLDFIAPVCGNDNIAIAPQVRDIDGYAWHGDKDATVRYDLAMNYYRAYNSTPNRKGHIDIEILPGVGHEAWLQAYDVTPGKDKLLQWYLKKFAEKGASKSSKEISLKAGESIIIKSTP